MVKRAPASKRVTLEQRVRRCRASLPFEGGEPIPPTLPRSMKEKQRAWLLDGLRAMGAPLAARIQLEKSDNKYGM